LGGLDLGEVEDGERDVVDEVREHVLGRDGGDLEYLSVVEAGPSDLLQVLVGEVAPLFSDAGREVHSDVGDRVAGVAGAIARDLLVGELEVRAPRGVGGEAVAAGVDLGDRERDALAGPHVEGALQRRGRDLVSVAHRDSGHQDSLGVDGTGRLMARS
jgi:hypothetical protein